jgi:hypothetical protein
MEEKMTKAQDFKSSRYRPLHSRYDWGGMLEYIHA